MEIDLSALDRLTARPVRQDGAGEGKDPGHNENASEGPGEPSDGKHYNRLEAERTAARKAAAAYREYQDNIKRGGQLMASITKGIQEGENLYTLLLWAMEALGKMTGDRVFYEQGKENLQAIYGALGYDAPIEHRTQEVQERLDRLCAALERESDINTRKRIERAITAHRDRLAGK